MRDQILSGKTALITGGGSGIGAASARFLAEDGAAVLITGRGEEALRTAQAEILEQVPGARVEIFVGAATDEDAVKGALERAHAISGRLDILVPSVGGTAYKPLLLQDTATFIDNFELNVVSAFLMIKHGVPLMSPGGSIVCVSSTTVTQQITGVAPYVASKAALERLVTAAALEIGGAGIRINAVRPGLTRSAATAGMYQSAELIARFAAITPLGRTGEPEDIAAAVRFLAGPEARWITGQIIAVDGGQALGGAAPDVLDELFGKELMDQVRAGRPPAGDA